MQFTKMQAVGNDFVVIEEPAEAQNIDLAALAIKVCDRRFGIGADGLLLYKPTVTPSLNPSPRPPSLYEGKGREKGEAEGEPQPSMGQGGWRSEERTEPGGFEPGTGLTFRIFNADGSEDTMCGNGLRCVVKLAVERGQVPAHGSAQTPSGNVPYALENDAVTLTLPPPRFWDVSVPGGTTVDTGSLHTVLWPAKLPEDAAFFSDSPPLESAPCFAEKTSVMWTVAESSQQLTLRIWERGVGETLGCGTGACAAAVVAIHTGRTTAFEPVQVTSKGGTLLVRWDGREGSPIYLTGPAESVFSGTLSLWI